LVVAIYVPCAATIAILGRELGWKNAVLISVCTFLLAVILGGAVYHLSVL
jgi:ferrous iron transport protein B